MTKEEKLENEEIKETEGTEETNEEEEVKEEFKSFIQEETREASEKALNEFLDVKAEELVSKFMQGIEKQRKVATSNKPKAVSEEVETIEDVIEPYLMQLGLLQRTPRGRVATRTTYEYLGVPWNPDGKTGTVEKQEQPLFGDKL